jgi:hypothetical protein
MKQAIGGIALIIGLFLAPLSSHVSASTNFVISEIQVGTKSSASQEYIQISNQSSGAIDITGWRLEYFSANPKNFTTPSRTISLNGKMDGGADYICASTNYRIDNANIWFSSTLASSGGHVRLVQGSSASPTILDQVGWGTAVRPEGVAVKAPLLGELLSRNTDASGNYIDSDNNLIDFSTEKNNVDELQGVAASSNIQITELLPNPAPPTADSTGEYIELYNPESEPVSLKGYKLLAGTSLSHSFVFKDQVLNPGFTAFFASETHLALSNSGGKVQLQSPEGRVISESSLYGPASDGQAWAWDGSAWQWSTTPTPNTENQLIGLVQPTTPAKKVKPTKAKKAKVSNGKVKGVSTSGTTKSSPSDEVAPASLHGTILAGVGGLAILYGVYEYRQEIALAFRKFRSNRTNRP